MTDKDAVEVHRGEPVSDYATKKALLVAQREDVVEISGHGDMTVVERTDTYYGPQLTLTDGNRNYRLHGSGFAEDPQLWRAMVEDGFVTGWEPVDHVSAEIAEVGGAPQCECGELLETLDERRMAYIGGICPHE